MDPRAFLGTNLRAGQGQRPVSPRGVLHIPTLVFWPCDAAACREVDQDVAGAIHFNPHQSDRSVHPLLQAKGRVV
jgi:hypothetical protein